MHEDDPLCVFLVIDGSRGQRMLFRYPFQENCTYDGEKTPPQRPKLAEDVIHNPYSLKETAAEVSIDTTTTATTMICNSKKKLLFQNGLLYGFHDGELASLMAPKSNLCNQKFELDIDLVKLIGYPVLVVPDDDGCDEFQDLLEMTTAVDDDVMIKMVNVVLAISRRTDPKIVMHYKNICMMLAKALRHEEKRVRYLTSQREIMVAESDFLQELPESEQNVHQRTFNKSELAKDFVYIFKSMCDSGTVKVAINGWLNLNYCLPHKIHKSFMRKTMIDTVKFNNYIRRIKPYHTLLLTEEENEEDEQESLIKLLPNDASPVLVRLIKLSSTVKNFQTLCQDADISLPQIFQIVAHLIYWGKCAMIYPLAESNIYVISENVPTEIDSKYAEEFARTFPGQSLHDVFMSFSSPITLGEYRNPVYKSDKVEHAHIVTWLLKRRLLKQLHTYVYIVPMLLKYLDDDGGVLSHGNFSLEEMLNLKTNEKRIFEKFSHEEQLSIVKVANSVDKEDLSFFLSMSKYFHGEHHLENIMYYENVSRSKLLILIDKFRSILITLQREDAEVQQIYSKMNQSTSCT